MRETQLWRGRAELTLDASIGVAEFGSLPLPTVEELLAAADAAMYAEKRKARDGAD